MLVAGEGPKSVGNEQEHRSSNRSPFATERTQQSVL